MGFIAIAMSRFTKGRQLWQCHVTYIAAFRSGTLLWSGNWVMCNGEWRINLPRCLVDKTYRQLIRWTTHLTTTQIYWSVWGVAERQLIKRTIWYASVFSRPYDTKTFPRLLSVLLYIAELSVRVDNGTTDARSDSSSHNTSRAVTIYIGNRVVLKTWHGRCRDEKKQCDPGTSRIRWDKTLRSLDLELPRNLRA
jgi:hypothetical protein